MTCSELQPLLSERSPGPLDPEAEALVAAHLAGCERCRLEAASIDETLRLAALPPPSAEEVAALSSLASSTPHAWSRAEHQRRQVRRASAALVAAAAVMLVVFAPWSDRDRPPLIPDDAALEDELPDLESWAMANPLAEELGDDEPDEGDSADASDPDTDDVDLYLNAGE